MTHYQGEDIEFSMELAAIASTDVQKWTEFDSVVVYLYTHTSHIAKFTNTERTGYGSLTLSEDEKTYYGVLSGVDTSKMCGALYMDIYAVSLSGVKSIKKTATGVKIEYTPIKAETGV